ncbi:cobalamin-binding protein [Thiomicrorhabdus sp. zzn3]|uniref:cobalamin-binding protein n=1 Tax=Thiomicrorhabdus sp. zzn3 TaxID=3039775 RepID=UPI0024367C62|nr:cobalamin-binding protein [Thiomicrorhabdus sp. zzn3]MDG6777828.1 cobalamin-binding protein [Thiomicrorhabdus sp. zzn3]
MRLNTCIKFSCNIDSLYAIFFCVWIVFYSQQAWSQTDSSPAEIKRIITLAPHLTEIVYSAGAGDKLVGVVNYSDYPETAQKLPIVGDHHALNLEAIIALKPDLILGWKSGNRLQDSERLAALGLNLFESEVTTLNDIPDLIERIGQLSGTQSIAKAEAQSLRQLLTSLQQRYGSKTPVSVFYQIWNQPLITMGKEQFISQGIALCGGRNLFSDLPSLTAEVAMETVLARNPHVILLGGQKSFQQAWLQSWRRYPTLKAVKRQQIYLLNNNLYQRPTARFVRALEPLCDLLDQARKAYDLPP